MKVSFEQHRCLMRVAKTSLWHTRALHLDFHVFLCVLCLAQQAKAERVQSCLSPTCCCLHFDCSYETNCFPLHCRRFPVCCLPALKLLGNSVSKFASMPVLP